MLVISHFIHIQLFVFSDCSIDESSCPGSLGYILNREVCFCYKVYTTKQNYDSSVKICENDNGELARISNALRQQALENALDGISSYAEAYIQGTRTAGSTTWYYNDGTEVTYFNWNTPGGQPQHRDDGEDYLLVRKTKGYRWHDVYKAEQHIVVCEIE
ncbi:hypothetical protein FSP39_011275 [Pinctada imbricata]|uniref:C-type lectin domain-containing protein n=1 Tax=Pinctada imbricata TaxID=66713 RepID=A0AA88Y8J8_PINIB|nr:hypothetical protein FSP39_011275 [Pinctada imbricata]